jgi:hypothetical protein
MSENGRKLTKAQRNDLQIAQGMSHIGGICPYGRAERTRYERLRARRLLKFFEGRRAKSWADQFYEITEAGRTALKDSQ